MRVGEWVKTPKGTMGTVADVRSFMDELAIRDVEEGKLFLSEARSTHGADFRKNYFRVLVQHGNRLEWFLGRDLKLVEGRGGEHVRKSEAERAEESRQAAARANKSRPR